MSRAFSQLKLSSLSFPPTLQRVESTAFYQSTISTISLPSSIKYFDRNALRELRGEFNLFVEDSEALINRNGIVTDPEEKTVFFINSSISEFEVQPTIEYIESSQVRASHIVNVSVLPGNQNFSSYKGVLYNKNGSTLIACPGGKDEVVLSPNCQDIAEFGFFQSNVKTVVLNEGFKSIGQQAFFDCKLLKSITIPSSLEKIWGFCFFGTLSMNIDIVFSEKLSTVSTEAFRNSAVNSIDFSKCVSIKKIHNGMFRGSKLRSIKLPPTLEKISEYSFMDTLIDSIEFPLSTSELEILSFNACKNLKLLNISNTLIKNIPDSCFEGSGITKVLLPKLIKSISNRAFALCKNLQSIIFAQISCLTSISPYIIDGCDSLINFKILRSVKEIKEGAFANSYGLQNFELESNNEKFSVIDGILFSSDNKTVLSFPGGRKKAEISKTVTNIQKLAFAGCVNLVSISFEEKSILPDLKMNTFLDCSSLENVVLPGSLQSFDSKTFSGCFNIKSISFCGKSLRLKEVPSFVFKGFSKLVYFEFHPNITSIKDSAFEGTSLLNVVLYNTTKIGTKAFFNCKKLNSIKIFSSLEKLGSSAFEGCSNLTSFSYCGKTSQSEAVFKSSGLGAVFVGRYYEGEKFG